MSTGPGAAEHTAAAGPVWEAARLLPYHQDCSLSKNDSSQLPSERSAKARLPAATALPAGRRPEPSARVKRGNSCGYVEDQCKAGKTQSDI